MNTETRGRALFNLIRMSWEQDPQLPFEKWQIEDYRILPLEDLFHRLAALGISLTTDSFLIYAENSPSPEDLIDVLWVKEEDEKIDQAYLLIFELWRRLLPEKQSLSIFCDELDYLIQQFDQGLLEDEEILQQALSDLERLLDEHLDQGEDPNILFEEISLYCAHDLESFVYEYISLQIEEGNLIYASELVDGFASYITSPKWFAFLKLRLLADPAPNEAERLLNGLLEELEEEPDLELLLEIARFLVNFGTFPLFHKTMKQARVLIQTEEDFQELILITAEYYRLLDKEGYANKFSTMLKSRANQPLEAEVSSSDPAIEKFYSLLKDPEGSEI